MDFTPIIALLLAQLWYLLPLLLIAALIKTPWFKGMIGEGVLNLGIRLFLDKREYHLLKDVTLPTPQGTTQIDHVIVSRFGIFVIETKNMKGWIFGNPAHKTWTQQIYRRRHSFQNPLRQNHLHVMTLRSLLGLADHQLHSVIYIYVSGGNTFFLLQELKRTGADKIIVQQVKAGKLYIGESAGSIVLSPDIGYVRKMDDMDAAPDLRSLSSLGLVPIYPLPHHTNAPFKETVDNIISTLSDKIALCPISNTQVIAINEDKVEIWGQ